VKEEMISWESVRRRKGLERLYELEGIKSRGCRSAIKTAGWRGPSSNGICEITKIPGTTGKRLSRKKKCVTTIWQSPSEGSRLAGGPSERKACNEVGSRRESGLVRRMRYKKDGQEGKKRGKKKRADTRSILPSESSSGLR